MAIEKKPSANPCAKTRPVSDPYEVYEANGWVWKILKKYASPAREAKDPYARWFCAVTSPWVTDELGDVYVRDIKRYAVRVK